jgi:hypothetical protein
MRRKRNLLRVVFATWTVAYGLVDTATGQESTTSVAHSDIAARASAGSAVDFAYALGEAGISAGFVVDEDAYHPPRPARKPAPRPTGPVTPTVDAEPLSKLFEASRPDYFVSVERDVVVGQHNSAKADPLLTTRRTNIDVANVSIGDAVMAAVKTVDPSLAGYGGTVGSWPGRPGESTPTAEAMRGPLVSVYLTRPTLIEALNEIARQAPGTVWLLVRHSRPEGVHYTLAVRKPNQQLSQYQFQLK